MGRGADEGGSLTQKSVSIGFGYQPKPGKNLLGFGLNWGQPNEDAWEPGLYDQYTTELFNRWQVSNGVPGTEISQSIGGCTNQSTCSSADLAQRLHHRRKVRV